MADQTVDGTFSNSTRISGVHHPVTVIKADYNYHGTETVCAAKLLPVHTEQDYDKAVREAINMSRLSHHPRVVKLLDYIRLKGELKNETQVALVMEY